METKKYSMVIGFDEVLETEILQALRNNDITPDSTGKGYFYIKEMSMKTAQFVKKLVSKIKFKFTKIKKKAVKICKEFRVRYVAIKLCKNITEKALKKFNRYKKRTSSHGYTKKSKICEIKPSTSFNSATRANVKRHLDSVFMSPLQAKYRPIESNLQLRINFLN